jgi:hypothetical protein
VLVTPPAPEPGIHLSLVQQGVDEGTRLVRLRIQNVTESTLRVRRVGMDWPGYGEVTAAVREQVGPDATLDLPFTLPPERCGAEVSSRPVGVVELTSRTLRREVDDTGVRFAERWWRTGCAVRRLSRAAGLSYGHPWRATGTGQDATLATSLRVVRRSGDERITLVAAQGTVLFDLVLDGTPSLEPGQRRGELPLAISPGRCDEHARSQASQPFTFRLNLQLGDDPTPLPVVVRPTREQQRDLLAFLDAACGSTTQH